MRLQEQAIICGVKIKWSNGVSIRKGSHTSSVCCNLSFSFQWLGSRSGCTWFPLPLMGSLCASTNLLQMVPKTKSAMKSSGTSHTLVSFWFQLVKHSSAFAIFPKLKTRVHDHVSFDLQFTDLSVQESYRDYTVWGFLEKLYIFFQFSLLLPIHLT